MQETGRLPPQKSNNGANAPDGPSKPDVKAHEAADKALSKSVPVADKSPEKIAPDKPEFKVTFERPETREAFKSLETVTAREAKSVPVPAPAHKYDSGDKAQVDAKSSGALALRETETEDTSAREEIDTRRVPTAPQMLGGPLLGLVAVLSLAGAAWSYNKLKETNALLDSTKEALISTNEALTAATAEKATAAQAKLTAEKALAETQGRLTTVEKTLTDIKTALTAAAAAAGTPAPANASAAPAEKPKAETPSK